VTAIGYPRDPTAVVGRRILAYGIDLVIAFAVVGALLVPFWNDHAVRRDSATFSCPESSTSFEPGGSSSNFCFDLGDEVVYLPEEQANQLTERFYGVWALVSLVNLVVLQGLTGASVGKLLTGLRVVRSDGRTAHIGWAALRWIVLIVDSFCCFLPGAVLVFSTKGHRRLGDMAASTFVVSRRDVGQPVVVPGVTGPQYADPSAWSGAAAPGWASPPAGPGWGAPVPPSAPAPTGDGPTWDEARNTYIQYDRNNGQWVQWDDGANAWKPIDT